MSYDELYYGKKLSRMLATETISEKDKTNSEKFEAFQKVLAELFPKVFQECEVVHIDSSLLIRIKGKTEGDGILLMSHQDVVPADGEWKYPPFSGEIAEGRVWGRGAVDTKGPLMCILQAMEETLEEGFTPECDVYFASSSNEETAGDGAPKTVQYLLDHKVRIKLLMDEGGMIVPEPMPGVKGLFAMIGTVEKGSGNFLVKAHGNGGHASAPEKNTPIARLSAFINDIEKHNPNKVEFSDTVLEMFRRLGPYGSGALGFAMRHAKALAPLLKKIMPSVSSKGTAMIRTTMAFTMCGGSSAHNVIPETAWVNINTRFIQHQGVEATEELLKPYMEKYDLELVNMGCNPPQKPVDYKGEAFRLVEETCREFYPGIVTTPYIMTGGTDAYHYHPVTDNAIRFAPLFIDNQQLESIHGNNENMYLSSLPKGVAFYKAIIRKA